MKLVVEGVDFTIEVTNAKELMIPVSQLFHFIEWVKKQPKIHGLGKHEIEYKYKRETLLVKTIING